MKNSERTKVYAHQFSISAYEVLAAILGLRRLQSKSQAAILRYKRHDKAIEVLKSQGVIYKAENNILHVYDNLKEQVLYLLKQAGY